MGGRFAQRASMTDGGAFSTTGIVIFGDRRSRRVVKGSCEACWLAKLPPLSELRKFWTARAASVEPEAAL